MKTLSLIALLTACKPPAHPVPPPPLMVQAAMLISAGGGVAALVKAQEIEEEDAAGCFAWGAVAEVSEVAAAILASGGDVYPAISVDLSECVALQGNPAVIELPVAEAAVALATSGASCEVSAAVEWVGGAVQSLMLHDAAGGVVEIPEVGICGED
jgi:hypothetical protein